MNTPDMPFLGGNIPTPPVLDGERRELLKAVATSLKSGGDPLGPDFTNARGMDDDGVREYRELLAALLEFQAKAAEMAEKLASIFGPGSGETQD